MVSHTLKTCQDIYKADVERLGKNLARERIRQLFSTLGNPVANSLVYGALIRTTVGRARERVSRPFRYKAGLTDEEPRIPTFDRLGNEIGEHGGTTVIVRTKVKETSLEAAEKA